MQQAIEPVADPRLPLTVITGYLGAGKTTLLNRLLGEGHGRRYAVIVNEFGEIGIDNDLVVGADEELFEMSNGCVCCSVRGDLIRTLHELLARPQRFDGVVLETTGLADPGPVAQTCFVDDVLQQQVRLDSIVAVVDGAHVLQRLADSREAAAQIACADQIVLNKVELLDEAALAEVEASLRRINPLAQIHRASRADVALDEVFGRGGFDLERIAVPETDAQDAHHAPCGDDCDHHAHDHHAHDHGHLHDAGIRSVSLLAHQPLDGDRVSHWLNGLVASKGQDILRSKGIVDVAGDERRLVFHSVNMLLEGDFQRPWKAGERRYSRMVFIGRNLDEAALRRGFDACGVH